MKALLSMRQHKIIRILRNRKSHMTSDEIAAILNVSSKTVRTDISDINSSLADDGIHIDSIKSKGFILRADDPEALKKFSKGHNIFLDRMDRVVYLALKLCMANEPLDLYDLEDELAVSSSTLTGDITALKKLFVHNAPFIKLSIAKSFIRLENDERKRRFIIVRLYSRNWDYNSTANAYYDSDYINSDAFRMINSTVADILYRRNIVLDDFHLISLNIYLSVTYHRLKDGLKLDMVPDRTYISPDISDCIKEIFSVLQEKLDFVFPEDEIRETSYILYAYTRMLAENYDKNIFPDEYHAIAGRYIDAVRETYNIDLGDDEKFYQRLILFISQLFNPLKDLSVRDTPDHIKQHLFVEFDLARLFYVLSEGKYHIVEEDLLYLAWALSGAFYNHFRNHPENRFNTIILCHMSVNSAWSVRTAVENLYGGYLNIKDIIPVYLKDYYDFSDIRLVLTTVSKNLSLPDNKDVIEITPYLSKENSHSISDFIRKLKIRNLYPANVISINSLLENAFVHEKELFSSQFSLIEYMCKDFIDEGIFTKEHMFNITELESVSSFACNPAVLLLYSTIPASETRLSVLTLDHRIMWNKYKIRIVFMLSLAKEDMNELFYMQNTVFHRFFEPEIMKHFKTVKDVREYYEEKDS